MSTHQTFALILAGGSGTRFWPLSRNETPKQLLKLFDDETLIEKTVNRLKGLVPTENIIVLTNEAQVPGIQQALPDLPRENIVAEPARRDTGPAVALAAGWVAARDPEAVMMVLPADQLVVDTAGFQSILKSACAAAASTKSIVTLGIKPDWACPGYGYIERGAEVQIDNPEINHPIVKVECFREKPSPEVAAEYLAAGNFSWNAGIFIWSLATLKSELSEHCPELDKFVDDIAAAEDFNQFVKDHFESLTKISIDYALMENASQILNIEADVGWDDVGGWPSVAKYFPQDDSGNAIRGEVTSIDSANNIGLSVGGKRIALLGVEDLIVVETEDSILVASRDKADDIKKLVDQLPEELT
ncbi:MAG: sugar phosphate nucleotidyltransferase [Verrucomicrobiales bacterium]|nr:sugar phosphate nucleotidyltransferase [Verrucomicrobiales bacterium]